MASIKILFASACFLVSIQSIYGHGFLANPAARNYAYYKGFKVPVNWDYTELFCGGAFFQEAQGGKCGVCGDPVTARVPRPNENGGKYGTGTIVKTYKNGQRATVEVVLTTNHLGHFEFSLCPLNGPNDVETEECFNKHPLELSTGGYKYKVKGGVKNFKIDVNLPTGLTCEHCSLRWHYRGANNWGMCENGHGAMGCGTQEHFRNCADVTIE